MQKRPQWVIIALVVIGVIIAGLLLFRFLNRGSDSGSLTGRTWQLASITGKTPAYQGVIPPAEQPLHTIAFGTDGTFAARADCNAMTGTYTLERSDGMTITPGPSTLVACPDGSYGGLFAHALEDVTTWAIAGDDLTLTTSDGGTGTFVDSATVPVVTTAAPSTPPSAAPSAIPVRRADTEPDANADGEPIADPHDRADSQPDGIPHPTGERGTDCGADGCADRDAGTDSDTDSAPTAAPTAKPTAKPTPAPTAAPPGGGDLVGTSWQLASYTTRDPVAGADVLRRSGRSTPSRSQRAGPSARRPTATC